MEAVVALFALLGFAFVPLGKKTALEHTHDIFTTPAALSAWRELAAATDRLRWKVFDALAPARTSTAPERSPAGKPPQGPTSKLPDLPDARRRGE
jgi:hypothetical protein